MGLQFLTKARTLELLQGKIETAEIAPMRVFSWDEWQSDKDFCIRDLEKELGSCRWIVRSSCNQEDGSENSNAGAFLSLPEVSIQNIESSIDAVFRSYGVINKKDEIFIQPMLTNVSRSGVGFSHDPNTSAPYRVVNWTESEDTTFITSGLGGRVWLQAASSEPEPPRQIAPIINLIEELEKKFDGMPIDCEFAVTRTMQQGKTVDRMWLLQARPLVLSTSPETSKVQRDRLVAIEEKISRGLQPHPFLRGSTNVYGVMPDWNPAEIIGIRPKPLALSLYRELITDSIWAYQRHNYGYRNLRSFPLMPNFFGLPYIDVRVSFNSFIPAELDDQLAGRLVDYYISRLVEEPTLHDKVEFEIVFSCYTLDLLERVKQLKTAHFSDKDCAELVSNLNKLTNRIIHPTNGLWKGDAEKLKTLHFRREVLLSSKSDILERIYWLIEDGKRYGTLPFAGLARAGFIGIQMLRSLVSVGIFTEENYSSFLRSVSTISQDLSKDRFSLGKSEFLSKYGHLRPGSYDILSQRYDEAPDQYFDWSRPSSCSQEYEKFELSSPQVKQIKNLLNLHNLDTTPEDLLIFIKAGIELRELAKFHFTRNLSDVLKLIHELGKGHGFSRDDLSYLNIGTLKEIHITGIEEKNSLERSIEEGKLAYHDTLKVSLPPLITNPKQVWGFEWPISEPNFITQKQVTAPIAKASPEKELTGKIVCIPNADPGFDWLFSYNLAGLITAWGGPNSHMAIRAGEIGLPALIGAGELLYQKLEKANVVYIDCAGKRTEVIS